MERNKSARRVLARVMAIFSAMIVSVTLVGCAATQPNRASDLQQAQQMRQAVKSEPFTEQQKATAEKAEAAMAAGQWTSARTLFEQLRSERPNRSEIHANLAWIAKQQNDDARALTSYRKAFELNPNDAASANNLSLLLREKGRFEEAVAVLEEGLEYSPRTAELHYNLAVISELYLLDLPTALKHYKAYQALTQEEEQLVAGWIADLERRIN